MKKILWAAMAAIVMCACSGERTEYPDYKGLPMNMSYQALCDTLQQRGFVIDTLHSAYDSASAAGLTALARAGEVNFGITVRFHGDSIDAIQESYTATYNDSTRHLWQHVRDSLEKTLDAWPNAPLLKEDHKLAEFKYNGGKISVLLENTYTPSMSILYETTAAE